MVARFEQDVLGGSRSIPVRRFVNEYILKGGEKSTICGSIVDQRIGKGGQVKDVFELKKGQHLDLLLGENPSPPAAERVVALSKREKEMRSSENIFHKDMFYHQQFYPSDNVTTGACEDKQSTPYSKYSNYAILKRSNGPDLFGVADKFHKNTWTPERQEKLRNSFLKQFLNVLYLWKHLEDNGMLHFDIKLENILASYKVEADVLEELKLVDFDWIMRRDDDSTLNPYGTPEFSVLGTIERKPIVKLVEIAGGVDVFLNKFKEMLQESDRFALGFVVLQFLQTIENEGPNDISVGSLWKTNKINYFDVPKYYAYWLMKYLHEKFMMISDKPWYVKWAFTMMAPSFLKLFEIWGEKVDGFKNECKWDDIYKELYDSKCAKDPMKYFDENLRCTGGDVPANPFLGIEVKQYRT